MKKSARFLIILLTIVLFGALKLNAQNASEILKKYDEVMFSPSDQYSEITLEIIDHKGNKSVRNANMMQKGQDRRLTRFTSPASQAGIGFLSLPNDVMYIYLPAFEKERRIATHIKNQNFAGTDFSYEDMEAVPYSRKYSARLLNTTSEVYILELIPLNLKTSEYSKVHLYVHKQHYYGIKTVYFNKSGQEFKTLVSKIEKRGKYWVAITAEMTNLLRNHKTKMTITNIVFDQGLKNEDFSIRNLKKI